MEGHQDLEEPLLQAGHQDHKGEGGESKEGESEGKQQHSECYRVFMAGSAALCNMSAWTAGYFLQEASSAWVIGTLTGIVLLVGQSRANYAASSGKLLEAFSPVATRGVSRSSRAPTGGTPCKDIPPARTADVLVSVAEAVDDLSKEESPESLSRRKRSGDVPGYVSLSKGMPSISSAFSAKRQTYFFLTIAVLTCALKGMASGKAFFCFDYFKDTFKPENQSGFLQYLIGLSIGLPQVIGQIAYYCTQTGFNIVLSEVQYPRQHAELLTKWYRANKKTLGYCYLVVKHDNKYDLYNNSTLTFGAEGYNAILESIVDARFVHVNDVMRRYGFYAIKHDLRKQKTLLDGLILRGPHERKHFVDYTLFKVFLYCIFFRCNWLPFLMCLLGNGIGTFLYFNNGIEVMNKLFIHSPLVPDLSDEFRMNLQRAIITINAFGSVSTLFVVTRGWARFQETFVGKDGVFDRVELCWGFRQCYKALEGFVTHISQAAIELVFSPVNLLFYMYGSKTYIAFSSKDISTIHKAFVGALAMSSIALQIGRKFSGVFDPKTEYDPLAIVVTVVLTISGFAFLYYQNNLVNNIGVDPARKWTAKGSTFEKVYDGLFKPLHEKCVSYVGNKGSEDGHGSDVGLTQTRGASAQF